MVRWVGSRYISKLQLARSPKLRPVVIAKDSFGKGMPNRDLFLSPLHRVMTGNWQTQILFGEPDILAHAFHLPQAAVAKDLDASVRYFHILCDRHEVIFTNGLPTETLYPGEFAMTAFEPETLEKISEYLATTHSGIEVRNWETALPCLRHREASLLGEGLINRCTGANLCEETKTYRHDPALRSR